MDPIIERCAGLDVHRDSITVCVRVPGEQGERHQEIRTFGTTTQQLLALRDWLASFGVTLVGMESTGVYWKPVYYVREDDIECWLLNAHHLRAVPGRKTDVRTPSGSASCSSTAWSERASCRRGRSASCAT